MKKFLLTGLALLLLVSVSARPAFADDATITFKNQSSYYLRFYVDGEGAGACPSGDQASTTASPGTHTLLAVTPDGTSVQRTVTLTDGGYFTWTITDN